MNPCEKHEAQDVQESGAGFDCKCCEIERLSTAMEYTGTELGKAREEIERLQAQVDRQGEWIRIANRRMNNMQKELQEDGDETL